MEIKTERTYNDFSTNVTFMQSAVSEAISNKDLVDDQFNTVKKYSFKWILLTLVRPFYALFGKDSYSHVRVNSVAHAVLAYCELNKKYLSDDVQRTITSEILEKLNCKTGKKYASDISRIANRIEQSKNETKVFWASQKVQLELLAQASWENGLPGVSDTIKVADKLSAIVNMVQNAADSHGATGVARATIETLIAKCWNFSFEQPDIIIAIKFCQICYNGLSNRGDEEINATYSNKTIFVFDDDKKLAVPAYWKGILSRENIYFKKMFHSNFRELQVKEIPFPGKDRKDFLEIFEFLKTGKLTLDGYSITERLAFAELADEICMDSIIPLTAKCIANAIFDLRTTAENLEIVKTCEERAYLKNSKELRKAVARYYSNHLNTLKTITQKVDFLKEHGLSCTELFLTNCTGEELASLVSLCPNLKSLYLHACNRLDNSDLKSISGCTKLKSLSLQNWQYLTSSGLYHIEHLKNLKWLDVAGCTRVWRKDLAIFDEQVKSGLTINSLGCADDEEERRKKRDAELSRRFSSSFSTLRPCVRCGRFGLHWH